jgi:hypothetical protein
MRRLLRVALSLFLLSASTRAARAADEPADDAVVEEARKHYRRGVEFYNDQSYAAALAEFRRAYETAPNASVLYNIGQLQFRLQDYAGALSTLQRYLSEGGSKIAPDRRTAVERDVERLRDRVAYVDLRSSVEGADVLVGDSVIGRTPLSEPAVTNIGHVRIALRLAGREVATWEGNLAAGDRANVELEPAPQAPAPPPPPLAVPAAAPPVVSPEVAAGLAPRSGESEERRHSPRWITVTWVAAGALTAGAATTGALALSAAADLSQQRRTDGATRSALDAAQTRVKTLALTTDALGAAALLTASVALYLTLDARAHDRGGTVAFGLTPGGVSAAGRF